MAINIDYSLYLVTDQSILGHISLEKAVEAAIRGGVTAVQIREKDLSIRAFYEIAVSIKKITDYYEVPLFINDRIDIAMAVNARGVHLGQRDMQLSVTRKILGINKIIGISAQNVTEALEAQRQGADYIGAGTVFYTSSKNDINKPIKLPGLKEICDHITIPTVAIGGINMLNIKDVISAGATGAAVISAILGEKDIENAAASLIKLIKEQKSVIRK